MVIKDKLRIDLLWEKIKNINLKIPGEQLKIILSHKRVILITSATVFILLFICLMIYLNRPARKIKSLFKEHSYASVISLCDDILTSEPENMEIRYQKGKAYFYLAQNTLSGNPADEITRNESKFYFYQTIVSLFPICTSNMRNENTENNYKLTSEYYYYLAQSFFQLGQYGESDNYRLMNYRAAYNYFRICLFLNETDGKFYETIVSGELPEVRFYEIMGLILFTLEKYNTSSEYFSLAVEKYPNEWNWYPLAVCYLHLDKTEDAKNYLLKVTEKSTTPELLMETYKYLAHIARNQRNYSEARTYYEKLLDLSEQTDQDDSYFATLHYELGLLYEQQARNSSTSSTRNRLMSQAFNEWQRARHYDPGLGLASMRLLQYNQSL